jgi:hypothetical protein
VGWREALDVLLKAGGSGWAVTGSAALALHGIDVDPQDLDIVATDAGAAKLERALAPHVDSVVVDYRRGALAADRRVTLSLDGTAVEILVGAWNPTTEPRPSTGPPWRTVGGVPVLELRRLRAIYVAVGKPDVVHRIDRHAAARPAG